VNDEPGRVLFVSDPPECDLNVTVVEVDESEITSPVPSDAAAPNVRDKDVNRVPTVRMTF